MKKLNAFMVLFAGASLLGACTQSTPSMMNPNKPRVVSETTMQQLPVAEVNDSFLYKVSEDYARYGSNGVQLFLTYDPASKDYSAMKAFNDLSGFKTKLSKMGVRGIKAETVKADGIVPTLMVSYDSTTALAPEGCRNMPGMVDGLTTREIGDYRFGCSVDSMVAQQIYRPSDLQGNSNADPGDGRRAANNVEYYRRVEQDEAEGDLNRIERSDLQAD